MNAENDELVSKLTQLLRQATPQAAPFAQPGPQPFAQPMPGGQPPGMFGGQIQPTGLLLPLSFQTQAGQVSAYLQLPAEALANPQAVVAQLIAAGWPIRIYQGNNGGGGGGGGGGGWQGGQRQNWGRRY